MPALPTVHPHSPSPRSVTSVGATINIPEQAANFSAGGFSNYWAQPSYQASAVNAYVQALGGANAGLYNASGRAYPDVAAYGWDYEIIADGEVIRISGTSAAAPTFASVVALLNDRLLAAGKTALGWLNPWLYSTAASQGALNAITEGNNFACPNYTTGFNATKGWNPVSVVRVCALWGELMGVVVGYWFGYARLREAVDCSWTLRLARRCTILYLLLIYGRYRWTPISVTL